MSEKITRTQGTLSILASVFLLALFAGIPLVLSQVEMPGPAVAAPVVANPSLKVSVGSLVFHDAVAQSREFIGYYHTIELTPEQEAIKKEVLGSMPAACCSGSSAYTCCCPCNLSKTIWGLSNYAIAKQAADARQLRALVDAWMGFVNPDGYRGNACYQGGCDSSLSGGGCGGMQEEKLKV